MKGGTLEGAEGGPVAARGEAWLLGRRAAAGASCVGGSVLKGT